MSENKDKNVNNNIFHNYLTYYDLCNLKILNITQYTHVSALLCSAGLRPSERERER
jgi:hypothetical protein